MKQCDEKCTSCGYDIFSNKAIYYCLDEKCSQKSSKSLGAHLSTQYYLYNRILA